MDMDGDESLKLDALQPGEIPRRLVNQGVQQLQELVVGLSHQLLVRARLHQSRLCVSCPYHLDPEDANLEFTSFGSDQKNLCLRLGQMNNTQLIHAVLQPNTQFIQKNVLPLKNSELLINSNKAFEFR